MFEKEAQEYVKEQFPNDKFLQSEISRKLVEFAEFGYNKANEWNIETPSSSVGNKDLLLRVAKDDFEVGYYNPEKERFYTMDGKAIDVLAWKEIVPPEEIER